MDVRLDLGFKGQDLAEKYLLNNAYQIIEKNFRFGHLEVDIIAFDKTSSFFVFVEVKTRSLLSDDVNLKQSQIKKLKKAMLIYSLQQSLSLENIRLDYIEIFLDKKTSKAKLKHLKNILN